MDFKCGFGVDEPGEVGFRAVTRFFSMILIWPEVLMVPVTPMRPWLGLALWCYARLVEELVT